MKYHAASSQDVSAAFVDLSPGVAGSEDCESMFTNLNNRRTVAEKCQAHHFHRFKRQVIEVIWQMRFGFLGQRAPRAV